MKRLVKSTLLLLCILFAFSACNNDNDIWQSPELSTVQTLMKESVLLKNASLDSDSWTFHFETQAVSLPADKIQSVTPNSDEWNTLVTFTDGSTLSIPTIGTSIDHLIKYTELNPSGYNPLAAEIQLYLPALGRIKVIVHTKEGNHEPDVEHLLSSLEKVQVVKVLGLYPDYNNQVELVYTDKDGNERSRSSIIHIQTPKLDIDHLAKIRVIKANQKAMTPGFNLISSPGRDETDTSCPYMLDSDGEIRWLLDWRNCKELLHLGAQCGLRRMKNGNYITGDGNNAQIVEVNVIGEIIHQWDLESLGYRYHHEVNEMKNGNLLVAVSKVDAMLASGKNVRVLDHVIEINPNNGSLMKSWDLANMLDSARYIITDPTETNLIMGATPSNWAHNNAIVECEGGILGSARYQGIFKYSHDGKLKWVISPHKNWRNQYKEFLLQPLDKNGNRITDPAIISGEKSGDDFDWAWGVHNPIMMPNGHILAFDNGFQRNFNRGVATTTPHSRIVEYEVDEANMTVRQVWQYGKERSECFAPAVSSVQYLEETGNMLFCPGLGNVLSNGEQGGRVIEVNPKTQEVVFEMELACPYTTTFHRAKRISLYPENL